MNDEFPLTIIERCQTCSILMLSGISALHPEPCERLLGPRKKNPDGAL